VSLRYCCTGALVLALAFSFSSAGRTLFPSLAVAANGQARPFVAPLVGRIVWGLTGPPRVVRETPRCQRMYATFQERVGRFDRACEEETHGHITERCDASLRAAYSDAFFAMERGGCLVEEGRE